MGWWVVVVVVVGGRWGWEGGVGEGEQKGEGIEDIDTTYNDYDAADNDDSEDDDNRGDAARGTMLIMYNGE